MIHVPPGGLHDLIYAPPGGAGLLIRPEVMFHVPPGSLRQGKAEAQDFPEKTERSSLVSGLSGGFCYILAHRGHYGIIMP